MPNQCCHAVRCKYLADFLVRFLGKKPQTLLIPIYSATVPYDTLHAYRIANTTYFEKNTYVHMTYFELCSVFHIFSMHLSSSLSV